MVLVGGGGGSGDNKLCGRPPQYAPAPCKLTFDLESGARVTCDVGYLCANFGLPRPPFCSRLRPDVRDRQTSDLHHHLMPPTLGVGIIINSKPTCLIGHYSHILYMCTKNTNKKTKSLTDIKSHSPLMADIPGQPD